MKVLFIFLLLIIGFSCTPGTDKGQNKNVQKEVYPPPPPLPANEQRICDSLKALAYHDISIGQITIAFNDTIKGRRMYEIFVYVLKDSLGFNFFRLDNMGNFLTLPHKHCIEPIMDSVIAAKYGVNAKDSIIHEAYRIAKIEYQKGKR